MHILFLTHYFPPEVNAPASRTYEHARRWAKAPGVKVTVITNPPNHPKGILYPGYKNKWLQLEEKDGISIRRVKAYLAANAGVIRRSSNYGFFIPAAILGSLRIPKPDLVVATSPQFFCAVAGYLISRFKRVPFVFELRDLWPDSIVTVGAMRPNLGVRLLERVELHLYRHAAHIIPVTESFKENLVDRGVPASKITVIKNGVDLDFFQPRPPSLELRRRLGAEGKIIVSYIGTIGMAHAVEKIVDVAERFRARDDLHFLVVGEGADKKNIEARVNEKGLSNFSVLPGVSKDQVRDYYAITDLNLVTLRKKALFEKVIPSKIFEIMGMARPILSSVNGEARQIMQAAGAAVYVEPENVDEMANAIDDLSRRPARLRKMGLNGREYVERHFSRDQIAARYLDLLRSLVNK